MVKITYVPLRNNYRPNSPINVISGGVAYAHLIFQLTSKYKDSLFPLPLLVLLAFVPTLSREQRPNPTSSST